MTAWAGEAQLVAFLAARFSAASAEQIGKISASLWMAGTAALHGQGIPIPAQVQAALAPYAMQAVIGKLSGTQFLVAIGGHLGSQEEFSRFLSALEAWYRREHGSGGGAVRPGSDPQQRHPGSDAHARQPRPDSDPHGRQRPSQRYARPGSDPHARQGNASGTYARPPTGRLGPPPPPPPPAGYRQPGSGTYPRVPGTESHPAVRPGSDRYVARPGSERYGQQQRPGSGSYPQQRSGSGSYPQLPQQRQQHPQQQQQHPQQQQQHPQQQQQQQQWQQQRPPSGRWARPGSDRYPAAAAPPGHAAQSPPRQPADPYALGPSEVPRESMFDGVEEEEEGPSTLFGEDPEGVEVGELFAGADPKRTAQFETPAFEPSQAPGMRDMKTDMISTHELRGEPPPQTPPRPDRSAAPPAELGKLTKVAGFEILELLGEGGMGRVYKAIQRSLDRNVALKVLNPALAQDESFSKRLEAEAKAAARLRHPNVVGVIEQGTCQVTGVKFVAFEYVDGKTAEKLLEEEGKLPAEDALTICLGIAEALSCAEDYKIVHRDVKPENILIGSNGIPMLADLGLAKRKGDDDSGTDTSHGLFMGTPHFAAPEQALGVDEIDIRADLYALGICLWQFLTGKLPFESSTPIGILTLHINEDVPDPRETEPGISENLSLLIKGLCARDREQRYATARDAAISIRRVLDGKAPSDPSAKGRVIAKKSRTGVRTGPKALGADDAADEEKPTGRKFGGRGFYDDIKGEKPKVDDSGVRKFSGRGFYDDPDLLGQAEEEPFPDLQVDDDPYGAPPPGAQDATEEAEEAKEEEATAQDEEAEESLGERIHAHGAGRGFYDDEDLLQNFRVDDGKELDPAESAVTDMEMLLSDDGERAYQIHTQIGEGTQALVYEARVQGETSFPGFDTPVESVAVKVAKEGYFLNRELEIYSEPDPRIVRLFDSGLISTGEPYLVLERLQKNPALRYGTKARPARVDPGTATEIFVNLLESLKGLHFRRNRPLILSNIKPDNIMLRMSPPKALSAAEYFERLSKGDYEPVFVDLESAKDKRDLPEEGSVLEEELGDPLYLPPEAIPKMRGQEMQIGSYSERTDVYSLCLTYYVLLTGDRPYSQQDLSNLQPADYLRQLLFLKKKGRSPVQKKLVYEAAGNETEAVLGLLQTGLDPDPLKRPAAGSLLLRCKRAFGLSEARPRGKISEHNYTNPQVRLRQRVFPRLNPTSNIYLSPDEGPSGSDD